MIFNNQPSIKKIIKGIRSETFYSQKKILSKQTIEKVYKELDLWKPNFNKNDILPTKTFNGWYHSMAMAKSKTVYDIITSKLILGVCRNYFGKNFRLKAHRVYSIYSGAKMPWHSDDKMGAKKHSYNGLIFIFYLKDVLKGQFQAIKDSEKFSKEYPNPKIDETIINTKYKDKIVDFIMPAGSMVVYNDKTIHRAKPYFDPFWHRTSLFIQIDKNLSNSEKIILNPSFVQNFDEEKKIFFGFGKKNDLPHEPVVSGLYTLSFIELIILILKSFYNLIIKKPYYLFRRNNLLIKLFKIFFKND